MSEDERQVSAEELIDDVLREAIAQISDGTLTSTRWVLMFEATDGDTRQVFNLSSENITPQDVAGLLAYTTVEVNDIIRTQIANRPTSGG